MLECIDFLVEAAPVCILQWIFGFSKLTRVDEQTSPIIRKQHQQQMKESITRKKSSITRLPTFCLSDQSLIFEAEKLHLVLSQRNIQID
jgi:hypothetical protein